MAIFKIRRVKQNKRGCFVPAGKRELYYTSTDPNLKEGDVYRLPGLGQDFFEILRDYGGGRNARNSNRDRRSSGSNRMAPYWMEG